MVGDIVLYTVGLAVPAINLTVLAVFTVLAVLEDKMASG
jgi:hypothetical protein